MTLQLYNTLHRRKEAFEPLRKGKVSFYTCGPTVYDAAHIGNLRTYVFEDTLRRWLKYGHGYDVQQVMNITDVEDKIIAQSGVSTADEMVEWTTPFEEKFHTDLKALGVEPAESYPRPTAFIPQMIVMIQQIIKHGFAYAREGSVYFDVQKYRATNKYGQLLNIDFTGFADGHRIDNDEYDKDNVQDFALWKSAHQDTPGWPSPWGYGRPGWHLECSVMAKAELGETIDLHTGGVDNIFPHHENEIAQSQAANGQPLAQYWLHAEHLLVDNAKMAKSAGNFYTLDDIRAKDVAATGKGGFEPLVLRLLFLTSHYRSKLNLTWVSMIGAQTSLERLQAFLLRMDEPGSNTSSNAAVSCLVEEADKRFTAAMDDDLNTPEALAHAFDFVHEINKFLDEKTLGNKDKFLVRDQFTRWDRVLTLFTVKKQDVPASIQQLVEEREEVRSEGDYKRSDEFRSELAKLGWTVEDTPQGPRIRKL